MSSDLGKPGRREVLVMLGSAVAAAACGEASILTAPSATPAAAAAQGDAAASCAVTPSETVGPYLSLTDLFRADIREGREGVPVTLTITVVDVSNGCTPVAGAAVDIWQCDADGHYSEYSQPGYNGRGETFLRGIQNTDAAGRATFTTIYPGWYPGRATHIHVDVSVNGVSSKVTQIAFPDGVTSAVYSSGVYAVKGQNPTTNARDGVFADGVSSETATVGGNPAAGYTATITIGIP